jgi:hypothetical protein
MLTPRQPLDISCAARALLRDLHSQEIDHELMSKTRQLMRLFQEGLFRCMRDRCSRWFHNELGFICLTAQYLLRPRTESNFGGYKNFRRAPTARLLRPQVAASTVLCAAPAAAAPRLLPQAATRRTTRSQRSYRQAVARQQRVQPDSGAGGCLQ